VLTGLRFETRDVDYIDSTQATASPDENLWGGRVALEYHADNGAFYYGLVSRGYKPGGFNLDGDLTDREREFDTETMINYELGIKKRFLNDALQVQAALFYQDRDDIQSKQSIVRSIESGVIGGPCPCNFTDFTDNASSGTNRGLELEVNWSVNRRLALYATLGLLDTEFDQLLTFDHVNADRDSGTPFNLAGREQAHAPGYQWVIGGAYTLADHWEVSGSIEAKDDFYFSDRHEERSDAYELVNLELAYQADQWRIALYGRNLTDELVKTRGFGSFGNDPRKFYATEPYNQFGAPKVVGVRASLSF
jgi:outer membrane receptor protein involved in Fe transport